MIYLVKNDGSKLNIGTIENINGKLEIKIENYENYIEEIQEYNRLILQNIYQSRINNLDEFIINCYDIESLLIGKGKWRRCTAYFIIQKSDNGLRFTTYLDDTIMHNGESFGTGIESITNDLLKKMFKEYLQEFIDNNEHELVEIVKINIKNFNNLYGI